MATYTINLFTTLDGFGTGPVAYWGKDGPELRAWHARTFFGGANQIHPDRALSAMGPSTGNRSIGHRRCPVPQSSSMSWTIGRPGRALCLGPKLHRHAGGRPHPLPGPPLGRPRGLEDRKRKDRTQPESGAAAPTGRRWSSHRHA